MNTSRSATQLLPFIFAITATIAMENSINTSQGVTIPVEETTKDEGRGDTSNNNNNSSRRKNTFVIPYPTDFTYNSKTSKITYNVEPLQEIQQQRKMLIKDACDFNVTAVHSSTKTQKPTEYEVSFYNNSDAIVKKVVYLPQGYEKHTNQLFETLENTLDPNVKKNVHHLLINFDGTIENYSEKNRLLNGIKYDSTTKTPPYTQKVTITTDTSQLPEDLNNNDEAFKNIILLLKTHHFYKKVDLEKLHWIEIATKAFGAIAFGSKEIFSTTKLVNPKYKG